MERTVLYKYSGAGNDFIVADGRVPSSDLPDREDRVRSLCDRTSGFLAADGTVGADGVIILRPSEEACFRMEFYNPDGSSGMMCGNGGRCIVDFASFLGIPPLEGREGEYSFLAPDGLHRAEILSREGRFSTVRLGMTPARGLKEFREGRFIDTGARHLVCSVEDVEAVDVAREGARLRNDPAFAPLGTNVDFVEKCDDGSIKIRTFEKGVEAETLACGTGVVASAIVTRFCSGGFEGRQAVDVHARRADLRVEFDPAASVGTEEIARGITLTGPVERIW